MASLLRKVAPPTGEVAGIEIRVDPPLRPQLLNRPESGDGHVTMTVTVPQDPNKRKDQSNDGASRAKRSRRAGKPRGDKKQNEGVPTPPQSVPVGGRLCHFAGGGGSV